jgi:hypothetical protein
LPPRVRDDLRAEAIRPWLAAGAIVEWADDMPQRAAGPGEPQDVYVTAIAGDGAASDDSRQEHAMAGILFVAGRPTTHITVHVGYVARLLEGMRFDDRLLADGPRRTRDRLLARVLGRVVAHELGHLLLGSTAHAGSGLMRANQSMARLTAFRDPAFPLLLPAMPSCLEARLAVGAEFR